METVTRCDLKLLLKLLYVVLSIALLSQARTTDPLHPKHHSHKDKLTDILQDTSEEEKQIDNYDSMELLEEQGKHAQMSMDNYNERHYIPSNCSRCRMLEETLNLTKEAIKQQILSKLGLRQPPNISGKSLPKIPPLNNLLDMYGMQGDDPQPFKPGPIYEETEDDYHAKTERIISLSIEPPVSWNIPKSLNLQYFKFSQPVLNNKVIKANLWIYLRPQSQSQKEGFHNSRGSGHHHYHSHHIEDTTTTSTLVHMYKVIKHSDQGDPVLAHIDSPRVESVPRKGGWVSVNVRKIVAEWFRYPSNNYGLVVQAFDHEGRDLVMADHHTDPDKVPFIEVHVTDESKRRAKRMIGLNCEENSNEVRCCRYPLTVDFEEFGWDWIIAPKKYEANYCSGECPFVFLQKYPHTHLVQQANPSGSAGPCCAPRKMSSISMLYFDDNHNIIYGLLPGMVVDRCGCS